MASGTDGAPIPPVSLIAHSGASPEDPVGSFLATGRTMFEAFRGALPDDRPLEGARILDFGCGAGRMLRLLLEIPGVALHGCDIHAESIEWIADNLPGVDAFVNGARPPLPLADGAIDIVYAGSVFTHLDDTWSAWLAEIHRLLGVGGVLVASFLGRGMSEPIAHEPWDEDRIGMNVLMYGQPWDRGGPSVLHSPWWLREHWGRGFTVERIQQEGFGAHGLAVLRSLGGRISPEELETLSDDPREIAALRHNIVQLQTESLTAREELDEARVQIQSLEAEVASRSQVDDGGTGPIRSLSASVRRVVRRGGAT